MWDRLGSYNQTVITVRPFNNSHSPKSLEGYIFAISRIFGIFPLDRNLKCTPWLVILTLCLRVSYTLAGAASTYYAYTFEKSRRNDTEVASYAVTYLSETVSMSVLLAHVPIIIRDRSVIKDCLSALRCWERQNLLLLRPLMIGFSILTAKCFLLATGFHHFGKIYKMFEELPFLLTHFQSYLLVLQFCAMLSVVQSGLSSAVNHRNFRMVDCLSHFKHVQILKALNETYGWQMLFTVFQIFSHSLISMFWIVIDINGPEIEEGQFYFIAANALEVFYRMYELSLVIQWSTETSAMVDKFNSLLCSSLRGNEYLHSNVELHFYASMKNSVVFTAKGFLGLSQPLATSIVTAAITYLVILLQFAKK